MRGIFGSVKRASSGGAAVGTPSYGLIPPLGSTPSASGQLISQATSMSVGAVYACVLRRATDVARCMPTFYKLNKDGTKDPVKSHWALDLLNSPNDQQTWFEFARQMNVGYILRANAYAVKRPKGAFTNDIRDLIPQNPDACMVLEAGDGSIFYNVNRIGLWQIAMLRDFPTSIPQRDMFHLRGVTFNSLVGASTIGLGRDAIGLAMGLDQQASRWIGNGARPSGVLQSAKQLTEDTMKRLRAQWQDFQQGILNVGKTAILEDGIEWKPMSLTSVDLEFIAQRNFSVVDICRFFGVPPHKVFSDASTRGASMNITQQDQDYVNTTVTQDLVNWEQRIEKDLDLDKEGIKVEFDARQLLRADILTRRNAARLGILSGLTTPNEERVEEGMPKKGPEADELLVPANTAALGSEANGQAPDGAGRPPAGEMPEPATSTSGTQPNAKGKTQKKRGADDLPPIELHLTLDQRQSRGKVVKRIETERLPDGRLVAKVTETEVVEAVTDSEGRITGTQTGEA